MANSKINTDNLIKQNTGAILNPAGCGSSPTRNFLSVGFGESGICEYLSDDSDGPTAPTLDLDSTAGGTGTSWTFTEGDGATQLATNNVTIANADAGVKTLTVTLTGIVDGASEVLVIGGTSYPLNANKSATGTGGATTFTIAYVTATQVFTITKQGGGDAPVADVVTLIEGITYANSSPTAGERTATFIVAVGTIDSNEAAATVTVADNVASVIDLNGASGGGVNASGTFTEGDSSTAFLTFATIADVDDTEIASLTITCGGSWGSDGTDEIISFDVWTTDADTDETSTLSVGSTTFSLAYVASSGVLTVTKSGGGTFPIADVQSLVRLFEYQNTATTPTEGARTFTFVVNDGVDNSESAVLTVTVSALVPEGDAIRVRRSTDSTSSDFTIAEILDGTLDTFVSTGDGFVSTWYDLSNSNDVLQGVTSSQPKAATTGDVEEGVLFDGTDDNLTLSARVTSGAVAALTFTCWAKTSSAASQAMASEYTTTGNQRGWQAGVASGKFQVVISQDGLFSTEYKQYDSNDSVNDGEWNHLAFTWDAGTLTLYINGVEAAVTKTTDNAITAIYNGTAPFVIGAISAGGANRFAGSLSDVRVYSSVLTGANIASIMSGGTVGTPLAWYKGSYQPAPNTPPVVDLNGATAGISETGTYDEGDPATTYLTAATLVDTDTSTCESLTMVGGGAFVDDGTDEVISFDTWTTNAATDHTSTLVVGSTTFSIAYVASSKTATITKSGGGAFPVADGQALIRLFEYENTASPITPGNRTFSWTANDGEDNSSAAVLTVEIAGAGALPFSQNFDSVSVGSLPSDMTSYTAGTVTTWATSTDKAYSGSNSLKCDVGSASATRLYYPDALDANVIVSATVYIDSLVTAQVFARGSGVTGTSQSWYLCGVKRSTYLLLGKYESGTFTNLANITSTAFSENFWATISLYCNGDNLRAQIIRHDTGMYLNSSGSWQSAQAWALNITDTSISAGGHCGIARQTGVGGAIYFDNIFITDASGDSVAPSVSITSHADSDELVGDEVITATATDAAGVSKVEFYVDDVLRFTDTSFPYSWTFDSTTASNGSHTISVKAYDPSNNIGTDSITITTNNDTAITQPSITKKHSHLGMAMLAYETWANWSSGLDATATDMIQNNVDIVVPSLAYRSAIKAADATVQCMEYTNFGNIYISLVTAWNAYADANALDREGAFYHVESATAYSGGSPSSRPVQNFWQVLIGSTSYYFEAASALDNDVPFPNVTDDTVLVGYPEKFIEMNIVLDTAAAAGWTAVLEYCTAVDGSSAPTTWATLTTKTETTSGLTADGQITFDPPSDWVPCVPAATTSLLYYVRWRVTGTGTRPICVTIHNRDYTGAGSGESGTIPAFDYDADLDSDGYLNDTEYAARTTGKDARFAYEGRWFTNYGAWRFVANCGDTGYRAFVVDYHLDAVDSDMDGFFVDNSFAAPSGPTATLLESVAAYDVEYSSLMSAVWNAIEPRWLMPNFAGAATGDMVTMASYAPAYYLEFYIRTISETASDITGRQSLLTSLAGATSPEPIGIIDTYPPGGGEDPASYRARLYALCSWYLTKTPNQYLMMYGGSSPQGDWADRWSDAFSYDVGSPTGAYSVRETGTDPSDSGETYSILQRAFDNALVLVRPLSATGADITVSSAVTVSLGASYQPVQDNGTLGSSVTSVDLRNGEAALLVPV